MKKLPLYIVAGVTALLLVVGVSGAAAYLMMKTVDPAKAQAATGSAVETNLAEGGKVVALKPFVTNLADADRTRYINVTFELVARNEKEAEKIQQHLPLIRDSIVGILSTKKSMEVSGEAGANKLKNEIQEKLNALLGGKYVQRVLMTDFAVQ